jgi:RNA-directed DNA polymerase
MVWFGTGETRLCSFVSRDRPDKPVVKPGGAQRESDGVVVPVIAGMHPAGGKGPDFDHGGEEGKRQGMTGVIRSNYPTGRLSGVAVRLMPDPANVRQLQNRLWAAAKQSSERRFHALYDRIYRGDVLWMAWERVRANRGAGGVDNVTLADVEVYGVERMLAELQRDLRAGTYHPAPVRRVKIPKPDGSKRPLGIPTVVDRVAQQAAKLILEPVFEADFLPVSFGFRPKRSATDALEKIRVAFPRGQQFVLEADILDFFSQIDHDRLMSLVEARISDRRVLKLVRGWLSAGVLDGGVMSETVSGVPQGGVISPLLANIFLHAFDTAWVESGTGELVRYADDFVVLCSTLEQAEQAQEQARAILRGLGLELHPDKTRVVDLREGREGFDFLGCHFRARMSGRLWEQKRIVRYYLHRWPSARSMKRARARIKTLTSRSRVGIDLPGVIRKLNLFLRGWGNYFRTGNAADKFVQLDRYVAWRLKRLLIKKRGRNLRAGQAERWTPAWFHDQGLHKLMGTIRYPKAA